MSDWIKVSEREPKQYAPIIAYLPEFNDSRTGCLDFKGADKRKVFARDDEWDTTHPWEMVTHWMPWPEHPKDVSA